MAKVKRTKIITVGEVINPAGKVVATIRREGNIGAARLANVARREYHDRLLTVKNVRKEKETYVMDESKFYELAEKEN